MKSTEISPLCANEFFNLMVAYRKAAHNDDRYIAYNHVVQYCNDALIAARLAGRDEQREVDAKICEVQMRHLDGIDSLGAGASRGWMNNCAEAIRNQQPSEGEKA